MLRRPTFAFALLPFAGALAAGCSAAPSLGSYDVTGQLQTNSCGMAAPQPWVFDIQLSRQGATLYWNWLDGSPLLSGTLNAQSSATLAGTYSNNVDGSADGGIGPCWIDTADAIDVALAAGAAPATFSGSISNTFTVESGADCSDQLVASGGSFSALPCAVSYTLTGTRQ